MVNLRFIPAKQNLLQLKPSVIVFLKFSKRVVPCLLPIFGVVLCKPNTIGK
jgi:hypothetical protein